LGIEGAAVDPVDAGVAAEPGLLSAGELTGPDDRLLLRLGGGQFPVEVTTDLGVADGPGCGSALGQPGLEQAAHLIDPALVPHEFDAGGDALVEDGPVQAQAQMNRRLTLLVVGQLGAEGPAGEFADLEGAGEAPLIVDGDLLRRCRVEVAQSAVQAPPIGCDLRLEPGPDVRVGAGELHMVDGGTHIEAGSSDEDGPVAAVADVGDGGSGAGLEVLDVRLGGDVEDVDEVVRGPAPLLDRQFRGADVHAPIELHRGRVHDLPAEVFGQVERATRLPRGGGPDDGDDRRLVAASVRACFPGLMRAHVQVPVPHRQRTSWTRSSTLSSGAEMVPPCATMCR